MTQSFDTFFAMVSLSFRRAMGTSPVRENFELPPGPMALSIELEYIELRN